MASSKATLANEAAGPIGCRRTIAAMIAEADPACAEQRRGYAFKRWPERLLAFLLLLYSVYMGASLGRLRGSIALWRKRAAAA